MPEGKIAVAQVNLHLEKGTSEDKTKALDVFLQCCDLFLFFLATCIENSELEVHLALEAVGSPI